MLGRERIVGDLRMRLRQPAQQRRFARVGQPDQAGVGDHLQFEDQPAFLARIARLGLRAACGWWRWRNICCRARRGPPLPTTTSCPASVRSRRTLPRSRSKMMVPGGTRDDEVLGGAARSFGAACRAGRTGAPVLAIDDVGEAVGPGDGADDDVAAVAAVAAVGPAFGDVLLAPEADSSPRPPSPPLTKMVTRSTNISAFRKMVCCYLMRALRARAPSEVFCRILARLGL